jgi:pimeloyl-ACP methyl ester carboxylesterase
MHVSHPRKFSAPRIFLVRILLILLLFTVALGVAVWRAPMWVGAKLTHFRLYTAGFHDRSIALNGNHVFYVEGGPASGANVVLIHGLGTEAQQDWVVLAPYLVRAGYHVYAMDLLGYGRSDKPTEMHYSVSEEARFVEAFLEANYLTSVSLGGVSMGGWIAATVALEKPQLISRLMLFDSAGMEYHLSFDQAIFMPHTGEQVDQLMAVATPNAPHLPDFVKADYIRRSNRDGWVVQRALVAMVSGVDNLDKRFNALKIPVLLVWGKKDVITPLAVGEAMHRAAPQSVLAVYDGCGHIAVVTCGNSIAPTMLSFLSRTGPEPGKTVEFPARRDFLMP